MQDSLMASFKRVFIKLLFIFFPIIFCSCKVTKLSKSKKMNIVFNPDISLFDTTFDINKYFGYFDFHNLEWSSVKFEKDKRIEIRTSKPTFFISYSPFLVYPGDTLQVSLKNGYQMDLRPFNNVQRVKEFSFLEEFSNKWTIREDEIKIQKKSDVLNKSNGLGEKLNEIEHIYNLKMKFLDSMLLYKKVGSFEFDRKIRMYYEPDSINKIIWLYDLYKDSLKNEDQYIDMYRGLLPIVNNLKSEEQIEDGYFFSIEKIADILLPKKIQRIINVLDFEACYHNASILFKGVTKDYILTRIMYTGYKKKLPISSAYKMDYYKNCETKEYSANVRLLESDQNKYDKEVVKYGSNALYDYDKTEATSIEKVIENNYGKIVIIDFCASWCVPCLEEFLYEKKLQELYIGKKIIFLGVSLDTEIQKWRNSILTNSMNSRENYVFISPKEADFIRKYNIEFIPRYMIFDKNGKIVNDDAPRPSDPKLKELIEKLLSL